MHARVRTIVRRIEREWRIPNDACRTESSLFLCPIYRGKGSGFHITIQPGQALLMTYTRKDRGIPSCSTIYRRWQGISLTAHSPATNKITTSIRLNTPRKWGVNPLSHISTHAPAGKAGRCLGVRPPKGPFSFVRMGKARSPEKTLNASFAFGEPSLPRAATKSREAPPRSRTRYPAYMMAMGITVVSDVPRVPHVCACVPGWCSVH